MTDILTRLAALTAKDERGILPLLRHIGLFH
jgi:hypothetical protein